MVYRVVEAGLILQRSMMRAMDYGLWILLVCVLICVLIFPVDPPEHKLKSGPASTGTEFISIINQLNGILNHIKSEGLVLKLCVSQI